MKHFLTHEGRLVQPTPAQTLSAYFRKCRADQVQAYHRAAYWPDRYAARRWVLHYGKLIRKLEGVA